MRTAIFSLLALGGLWFVPTPTQAEPFVYRRHYLRDRQHIPSRTPSYETYYVRKYGQLPPFRNYAAPVEPVLTPGFRLNDIYLPGVGFVPQQPVLD